MELADVVGQLNKLLFSAIAPSTKQGYTRAWQLFDEVMSVLDIPYNGINSLPLSYQQIVAFISFMLAKRYAPTTVISYVSALSYAHKMSGLSDPCAVFAVQKVLASATKISPSVDHRLPITLSILSSLTNSLKSTTSNPYLRSLFKAMYIVSFFALMRVGEITTNTTGNVALMSDQIRFFPTHVILTIRHFKHNVSGQPVELVMTKQTESSICPVNSLIEYFHLRGSEFGPLFCFPDLKPIPRQFFIKNLKLNLSFCGLNTSLYQSHSFRIGGASFFASLGFSDEQIRLLGRWKTNSFRIYIRGQRLLVALQN